MIAFLIALSAATAPPPKTVIEALKAELKDADSAKFRGIKKIEGGWCGWVNAKNSYGGYTGYSVFFYYPDKDPQPKIIPPDLSEPELCQ